MRLGLVLAATCLAGYSTAIFLIPGNVDDLVILGAVAEAETPFQFFIGDWGLGNNAYRPLHTLSVWVIYQLVGVSALPSQALNVLLHLICSLLLFRVAFVLTESGTFAVVGALLFQFSIYTVSPAIWVSDRPSLLVGVAVGMLVNHLVNVRREDRAPSPAVVGLLSIFAMLSKESGLVVPALAFVFCALGPGEKRRRAGVCLASVSVAVGYLLFRLWIFGSPGGGYSESGYLGGLAHYGDWAGLSWSDRFLVFADNILKNLLAPFLLIFSPQGELSLGRGGTDLLFQVLAALSTLALVLLAIRGRRPTLGQVLGLTLIVFNALVHYAVFRYRVLYLSQFGLCLFIATIGASGAMRRRAALVAAAVLFLSSTLFVGRTISTETFRRHDHVRNKLYTAVTEAEPGTTVSSITEQVVERYVLRVER